MWDLQWDLERSSPLALSSPHPTEFSGGAPAAGINPFRDFKLTPFYKAPPPPSPLPGKGGGGATGKRKQSPGAKILRGAARRRACQEVQNTCGRV